MTLHSKKILTSVVYVRGVKSVHAYPYINERKISHYFYLYVVICILDDVLEAFPLSALTINAFWPSNHKKCFGFALLCLWNVQIQILKQPS